MKIHARRFNDEGGGGGGGGEGDSVAGSAGSFVSTNMTKGFAKGFGFGGGRARKTQKTTKTKAAFSSAATAADKLGHCRCLTAGRPWYLRCWVTKCLKQKNRWVTVDSMFLIMDFVQHLLIQFLSERKNLINVGMTNPVTGEMMSYSNKCVAVRRVCVRWGGEA